LTLKEPAFWQIKTKQAFSGWYDQFFDLSSPFDMVLIKILEWMTESINKIQIPIN